MLRKLHKEKVISMCTTIQKQDFMQVIDLLPEDRVKSLLDIARDMVVAVQVEGSGSNTAHRKVDAFEAMERMRQLSPFPKDADYAALWEEGVKEKYAGLA